MATVQALRKDHAPPPRSPERQQLADAIGRCADAEQHLATVISALQRADAASMDAFRAVKKAKGALEDAEANKHDNIVAAALGGNPGASLDDARAALAKAESDHAAARGTADALVAEQAKAAGRVKWARQSVDDAVRAVLKASPEVARLQNDVAIAKRALDAAIGKLLALPPGTTDVVSNGETRDAAWSAAVAALATAADTELPQR